MSVSPATSRSTRKTATKSVSTDTVEKIVSAAIDRNVKYVAKAPTANLAAFAEFVTNELDKPFATKAENENFAIGVRLAGLRASFQKDRKDGKIPTSTTFEDYAIESSGITVPTGNALVALKAGIATYKRYVAYRASRESSKVSG